MAHTGTSSLFKALELSASLFVSLSFFRMAEIDAGVTAHLKSSLISAPSSAVEWILKVKLGSCASSFGSDAKAELSLRSMVRKLLSTTPRPEG